MKDEGKMDKGWYQGSCYAYYESVLSSSCSKMHDLSNFRSEGARGGLK